MLMPSRASGEQQLVFQTQLQCNEFEQFPNNKVDQEKHNAEKLVEGSNACRRNVFQFDTLHAPKTQQSESSAASPTPSTSLLVNHRGL